MDIISPSQGTPTQATSRNEQVEEPQAILNTGEREELAEHVQDVTLTGQRLAALLEWVLAAAVGLTPLLFLPWGIAPTVMGKEILLTLLTGAAAVLWISHIMTTGAIRLTRSWWYIPLGALLVVTLLSTWFSLLPSRSIWHVESPSESLGGILTAVLLAFLLLNAHNPASVLRKVFTLFLPAAGLLGIINVAGLFGYPLLPFDFAKTPGFTTVGSQNAFALFAVFALVIAIAVSKLQWSRHARYGLVLLDLILFANLFLINFRLSWFLLAFGIAVVIGMRIVEAGRSDVRRLGLLLPLLVVALVFGLVRQQLVSGTVQMPLEVLPTQLATLRIARHVFGEGVTRTLLGSGPATFVYDWEKYQEPEINLTAFWGVRFRQGSSGALTALAAQGIFGVAAYLALLLLVFVMALRRLRLGSPEFTGLFAGGFVLSAAWVFYPANLTLHTLLIGTLALLSALTAKTQREISFVNQPRKAVLISMALVISLVGIIAGLYRAGERYVAYRQAQVGIGAFNEGANISDVLPALVQATNIAPREDALQRLLAEALLVRLQGLLQPNSGASPQDLQEVLSAAIQVAQAAIARNALDGNNWATLGNIYENVIPFVDGADRFAVEAYKKWEEVSPQNPFPHVAEARARIVAADRLAILANQEGVPAAREKELEAARRVLLGDAAGALRNAIERKADYADAHFLLAQIYDRQGNLSEAIRAAENTKQLDPFGTGIAFQLGFLYYKGERFDEAEQEFKRAVNRQPNYSNARYFLGIIYDRKGDTKSAIEQFEEIAKLNPDNTEVQRILANLRSGRAALANIVPPAPAPEEREEPPVEEQKGKEEKALR
ncbi:MAG: tetratricopeptide repeat protein [bacterium]|nr:tetratricopeptide repeat protein [bacterium]MDZ4296634.1 tetratricopeptide repeat protein [Patescibacteria group bacterium]